MSALRALYPAVLAAVDLTLGGGLLALDPVAPVGLVLAGVGALLAGQLAFHAAARAAGALRRAEPRRLPPAAVPAGGAETVEERPDATEA